MILSPQEGDREAALAACMLNLEHGRAVYDPAASGAAGHLVAASDPAPLQVRVMACGVPLALDVRPRVGVLAVVPPETTSAVLASVMARFLGAHSSHLWRPAPCGEGHHLRMFAPPFGCREMLTSTLESVIADPSASVSTGAAFTWKVVPAYAEGRASACSFETALLVNELALVYVAHPAIRLGGPGPAPAFRPRDWLPSEADLGLPPIERPTLAVWHRIEGRSAATLSYALPLVPAGAMQGLLPPPPAARERATRGGACPMCSAPLLGRCAGLLGAGGEWIVLCALCGPLLQESRAAMESVPREVLDSNWFTAPMYDLRVPLAACPQAIVAGPGQLGEFGAATPLEFQHEHRFDRESQVFIVAPGAGVSGAQDGPLANAWWWDTYDLIRRYKRLVAPRCVVWLDSLGPGGAA